MTELQDIKYIEKVEYVRQPKVTKTNLMVKIEQYDWDTELAYAIMLAESNASSTVVNWGDKHKECSGSIGLFQIGCFWADNEKLKDPDYNIEVAYQIYSRYGWQPWGAYTDLRYRQYLD